jgi:phospholipid:diacylglycerol acyltransferase
VQPVPLPGVWNLNNNRRGFQVDEEMRVCRLDTKYPMVLILGIISTNLESWSTDPEYRPFFRQRIWVGDISGHGSRWLAADVEA